MLPCVQAVNTNHTLTTAGTSDWSTATWTGGAPTNLTIGDTAIYQSGLAAGNTTLNTDVTLGVLRSDSSSGIWTLLSNGTNSFTMDATGMTNNPFGVAGEAAIVKNAGSTGLIVNPNITIAHTHLAIGTTANAPVTVNGAITATTDQSLFLRGNGSGGIALAGTIGATGSNIAIANVGTSTGTVAISGALGPKVTSFTQASATSSSVTLSGSLAAFTGTITLSAGNLTLNGVGPATGNALTMTAGTVLSLTNTTNASNDRITGDLVLGLNGAFNLQGNAATSSVTEAISSLRIETGNSTVTLGGSGSGQIVTLAAANVSRTGTGTALIRGSSLGTAATNSTRVTVGGTAGTGLTLIGTTTSSLGAGNGGTDKQLTLVPYLIGSSSASSVGTNFLTYDTHATTGGLRVLGLNEQSLISSAATNDNVKTTAGANAVSAGAKVFNSLLLGAGATVATPATTAATVTGAGGINDTLTLTSGALANVATGATGSATISGFSSIIFGTTGANEAIITNANATVGGELTIGSAINTASTGGGLTKAGGGTLILTAANLYTGPTSINQGTLQIGNGGSTGDLGTSSAVNVSSGASLIYNRTGDLTLNNVTGGGIVTANSGTLILNQTSSGLTLNRINGLTGSTILFSGSGVTTIGNAANASQQSMVTAGQLYRFTSGTVNFNGDQSRGTLSNIEISGGIVNVFAVGSFSLIGSAITPQTLTITSGQLNILGAGYMRMNGNGGATSAGTAGVTITTNHSGGAVSVASSHFEMGSISANDVTAYNLSGTGTLGVAGTLTLGADTAGTSTTTFNLSGGKLSAVGGIAGGLGNGAKQSFVWTGGTLVTSTYTATNLTSALETAVNTSSTNILTNAGGTLAPGDIGITGRTSITGKYNVTSPNAVLAIDIAGTTASSAYQDAAATNKFDVVNVSQTAALGGKLTVRLLDGFTPTNANTFKILTTTAAGLSGTFTNTAAGNTTAGGGVRVALANGLSSFLVTYNTADVTLGKYLSDNQWTAASGSDWSAANNWTAFTPSLAGHIAKFADTPSAGAVAINLDADQSVAGIQFNSTTRNYTISSGTGKTLTFDNNGSPSTISFTGTQAITVPLVLANTLSVSGSNLTDSLTLAGVINGTSKSVAKTGQGTLTLSGDNTYTGATEVKAGTLNLAGNLAGNLRVETVGTLVVDGNRSVASATFLSGATVNLDITSGSTFDSLTSVGAVAFNGTLNLNFTGTFSANTTITLFDGGSYSGGFTSIVASGDYTGTFNAGPDNTLQLTTLDGGTFIFSNATGDLSYVTAIPEPSAAAVLAALAAGLSAIAVRRRTKRYNAPIHPIQPHSTKSP